MRGCNTHFLTGETTEQRHVSFKVTQRTSLKMMKHGQIHAKYNRVPLQYSKSSCTHLHQVQIWLAEYWTQSGASYNIYTDGRKKPIHFAPSLEQKYVTPSKELNTQTFPACISDTGEMTQKLHIYYMFSFSRCYPQHTGLICIFPFDSFHCSSQNHILIVTSYISRNSTRFSGGICTDMDPTILSKVWRLSPA